MLDTLSKRYIGMGLSLVLPVAALLALALGWSLSAAAALPAGDSAPNETDTPRITDIVTETVPTLNISNEAPARLIDALSAQGHGNETLFEVLGYLKAQTGAAIPDAFYQDVAAAPAGSEIFTAKLANYAGINGSVEISADGTVHMRGLGGSVYAGRPGYQTISSQDARFTLTVAQDADHYIYTGAMKKKVGTGTITYEYYAFAIAWKVGYSVYLPLALRNP